MLRRLQALPQEVVVNSPWLCLYYAWVLWMTAGDITNSNQYLNYAQEAVIAHPLTGGQSPCDPYTPNSSEDSFWGGIITLQSYLAHEKGIDKAILLANKALDIVPKSNFWLRSLLLMNLGGSYYFNGQSEQAQPILQEAISVGKSTNFNNQFLVANNTSESAVTCLCMQAELKELAGDYTAAISLCEEA